MSYQIPTHFVEQIIKNFSGSVIININKEINYLFGSDVKCPDFYKNAKIYLEWEDLGEILYLSFLEKLTDIIYLNDIIILLNIFESIGRIKRKKSLRIISINEKISKKMLLKLRYTPIKDLEFNRSVNLEGLDLYEKKLVN